MGVGNNHRDYKIHKTILRFFYMFLYKFAICIVSIYFEGISNESILFMISFSIPSVILKWAIALTWSDQIKYTRAPWRKFEVNGVEGGLVTEFKNF